MDKKFGNPRFYELLKEIEELYSKKNKQYNSADDTLGHFKRLSVLMGKILKKDMKNKPLATCLAIMSKQIDAVYDMVGENKVDTPDKLEDKFKDIAIYSLICIILSEQCGEYEPKIHHRFPKIEDWETKLIKKPVIVKFKRKDGKTIGIKGTKLVRVKKK